MGVLKNVTNERNGIMLFVETESTACYHDRILLHPTVKSYRHIIPCAIPQERSNQIYLSVSIMSSSYEELVKLHVAPERTINRLFQKTPLKGVHAYQDVNYMKHDGTFCELCHEQLFYHPFVGEASQVTMLENHVRSDRHEIRYFQLWHAQKKAVEKLESLCLQRSKFLWERVEQLVLPAWRYHMSDLILQSIAKTNEETEWWMHCYAALEQLAKYEQMERLSLLELAILKSNRCTNTISGDSDGKCDSVGSNEARLVKSGAAVIIPLVVPFLGKPPPIAT